MSITINGAAVRSLREDLYDRLAIEAEALADLCEREEGARAYVHLTEIAALLDLAGWAKPAAAVTLSSEAERSVIREVLCGMLETARQCVREEHEQGERTRQWEEEAGTIEVALAAIDAGRGASGTMSVTPIEAL